MEDSKLCVLRGILVRDADSTLKAARSAIRVCDGLSFDIVMFGEDIPWYLFKRGSVVVITGWFERNPKRGGHEFRVVEIKAV